MDKGIVPVIATYKDMNVEAERRILHFFENQQFLKVLVVHVKRGQNIETSKYLAHGHRDKNGYPYVTVLNNNRVIRDLVFGYDEQKLNDILEKARRPKRKHFVLKRLGFTIDMENIINKIKNQREKWRTFQTDDTFESQDLESPKLDLELKLGILGYQANNNLRLDLNKQPDMFEDSNSQDKSKRLRSPSTSGQTGPDPKKRKGKNRLDID